MKINPGLLLRSLVYKLWVSIKRFPQAILLAASAVIIGVVLNHSPANINRDTEDLLLRITMILTLGVPLFASIKIYFERAPKLKLFTKVAIQLAAALSLVLYFFFLLKDFSFVPVTRYTAFTIVLYLIFLILPQIYNRESYEIYVITLLIRFIVTYVYSLVLVGGLSAIIITIDKLFSANISGKVYFDIFIIIAGIFAPIFFLAELPQCEKRFDIKIYPKVLRILLLYIVMPIISVYSAILYAYFGKIIITRQWPQGIVSNLVLWYSLISTLFIFFIYPLKNINKWVRTFILAFPKLIIPLLGMMFVSMGIRINAYGITENRYFVLLAGIWVAACMIYFSIRKEARNIVLLISLAIFIMISVTGPWGSFYISRLSQNTRFENILDKYDMIKDGSIVKPSQEVSDADKKEISSIVSYFETHHSLKELKYAPKDFSIDKMENVFGFPTYYGSPEFNKNNYFSYSLQDDNMLTNIKGYDLFLDLSGARPSDINTSADNTKINYGFQNKILKISQNNKVIYSKNIADIVSKIYEANGQNGPLGKNKMIIYDTNENVEVTYVFKQINGFVESSSNNIRIEGIDFYVLIKFIK